MIGKTWDIFEDFYITTQDIYLVDVMDHLSYVLYLNQRVIFYVSVVAMFPKC